jgi:drug/metabolite transporter (DMT)-like permease
MLLRSFSGFIGYLGLVASVKFMPVSTASCIYFTLPIWAAILAFVFLNEKINRYDILQIFSAFLGIMIINNPFSSKEIPEKVVSKNNDY